jgi:anti-sigma B factor antagonist
MRPSRVFAERSARPPVSELSNEFRVEVEPRREAVGVCPIGDLDLSTVDEVRAQVEELMAAGFKRVVLDLRQTTFLDSTGLRLVLEAHAASARDGCDFAVIAGPSDVQRVFEVAGLDSRLPFVEPGSRRDGGAWA